jgi:hypothetical protein
MVMFEQSKRLSGPLRWTRAGRIAVIVAGACLLAAVAAIAIVALTSSPSPRGCIDYTFPSTLGAANVHVCGSRAREQCASPTSIPLPAATVAGICRRAGLRVGP